MLLNKACLIRGIFPQVDSLSVLFVMADVHRMFSFAD